MDPNSIIIENAKDHIADIERRLKMMESWGISWKNSSFYNDLRSQRQSWIARKNKALKAISEDSV